MSLNDYDFTAEMQAGRDLAQRARNRGQSARTRGKWAKAPQAADTPENRLYAELADLRRDLRDKENTIAVLRQNGGSEPDDFGSEFDRLFTAAKREGPGLQAEPQVTVPRTHAREDTKGETMTNRQYLAALKKLGLSPAARRTAEILGLSVRQCQRIAAGQAVPETLSKLLACYLEHGLPPAEHDAT